MSSSSSAAALALTGSSPPLAAQPLSPLEQEVLEEYERLLANLNRLARNLSDLSIHPTAEVLDGLRMLERKTSLVFTLLKASVYSIVLQQQIYNGEEGVSE